MTTTNRTEEAVDLGNLLGQRLRERRRELGLTLADVASAAGISVGHSSSIEKGVTLPSLAVLARLAHTVDLTLAEVLGASASPRIAQGRLLPLAGFSALSPPGSRIQISYAWQPAGAAAGPPLPLSGGDVFVFVHAGSLMIEVDEASHALDAGDSIHSHSPRRISWSASSAAGAGAVWVVGTGGRPDAPPP